MRRIALFSRHKCQRDGNQRTRRHSPPTSAAGQLSDCRTTEFTPTDRRCGGEACSHPYHPSVKRRSVPRRPAQSTVQLGAVPQVHNKVLANSQFPKIRKSTQQEQCWHDLRLCKDTPSWQRDGSTQSPEIRTQQFRLGFEAGSRAGINDNQLNCGRIDGGIE